MRLHNSSLSQYSHRPTEVTHGLSPITWSIGFMPVKNAVSEELGLCGLHIKTGSQTKQSDRGQQ